MPFRVFISYSTRDLATANALRSWVELARAECFLAEVSVRPSQDLSRTIESAIRTCDLFVLLWSHSAAASEWVPQEVGIALGCKRTILPVILQEGITPPAFVRDLKYLEMFPDPNVSVQRFYAEVADRIRAKSATDDQNTALAIGLVIAGLVVLTRVEK